MNCGYSSVNHLEIARNHFRKAEVKMLDYYSNLKTDYKVTFNEWELVIHNDLLKCNVDLSVCCEWEFCECIDGIYSGIKFRMGDDKVMSFLFNRHLFIDELCFVGLHEIR